ncbi:MAG: hypothetical protein GW893_10665, partial [Armatimonadetes bacterium]|nr:hypothetical protein [Armatimonadota bacterium]
TDTYATNDLYETTDPVTQEKTQSKDATQTATYVVKLENDSDDARSYEVAATETGWTVEYYLGADGSGGAINDMDTTGHTFANVAAGSTEFFQVRMTPAASATGAVTETATLTVTQDGGTQVMDTVKASTTANTVIQPDALIKQSAQAEGLYAIDDTYQATPSGDQLETLSVAPNGTATYNVKIENDGNTTRTFVLKVVETGESGWDIVYKKADTTEITADIRDADGYETDSLAPGAEQILTIEVTPDGTPDGDTTTATTVNVYQDAVDATVDDSVKATTTLNVIDRPDALVKQDSEADTAYAINDTYQTTTPSGDQTEAQTVGLNETATYQVKIENDGNT